MTELHKKISASVVLVLVLVVSIGSLSRGSSRATGSAASSSALAVGSGSVRSTVVAGLGVVEPRSGMVDIAALMPGVLAAVHVREGDRVRRGDVLAELVNEDLKARLAQSEAVLAAKTAQMNLIVRGPRPEEVKRAEAQLREEESNMRLLQLQFNRRQALVRDGAVSAEAFNEVSSRLAASRERYAALSNSVAILRQGSRPEEIEAARAEVRLAQSQVTEAQASLAKSLVRASIDGIVLRRYREPGEALSTQPAIAVLQIADVSNLVVRTQIDETDILELKVGQSAQITATALNGRRLTGRVERISPRVGAKTVSADLPTEKRDTRVLDVIVALGPDANLPVNFRVDVVIDVKSSGAPAAALSGMPTTALRGSINDTEGQSGASLVATQAAGDGPHTPGLLFDLRLPPQKPDASEFVADAGLCRELCPSLAAIPHKQTMASSRLAMH